MKNLGTILGGLALLGVLVLFGLHFSERGKSSVQTVKAQVGKEAVAKGRIGWFEMDSVENQYEYLKEVREQLKRQEQSMGSELENLKRNYMNRIKQLQAKEQNMTMEEGQAAQAEINQMQMNLQQREAKLGQDLQEKQFKLMQDINFRIESFLKGFNTNHQYEYILSKSPGDFIYFADSTFNITKNVIEGLNTAHAKSKAK